MRVILLAAALISMASCTLVRSVHPIYDESNTVYDPSLVGVWKTPGEDEVWLVRPAGGDTPNAYFATSIENGKTTSFSLRMIRIGETRFLDITELTDTDINIKAHLIGKIEITGPRLQLWLLNSDWVKQSGMPLLDQDSHEGPVLLAPTSQLAEFLKRNADNDAAWAGSDPVPLLKETW